MLYSIKLGSVKKVEEPVYDIEYAEVEELLPKEQELAKMSSEKTAIETNRAYNEAEKMLAEMSQEELETSDEMQSKMDEIDAAIESSNASNNGNGIKAAEKASNKNKKPVSNSAKENSGKKSANRNTTVSYRLVNRSDLDLPNPVYTCEGSGKVVINIVVDSLGKVVKTSYSESASTTANGCLIDSAIEYAEQARFTTKASKKRQLGTITYNFPGQ
ncbi:energy transducer TonB [Marixanthomonas ophiurae]|uniref:Energy transducer TonB n=1 Tax=Marixanthomonas ophiurae TaxID=387659 RepID=A0A3E1QB80_9FLAO|nr:energy transducer TonB [Marixanthomonas ophiurae]